jgi:hypothetical protein
MSSPVGKSEFIYTLNEIPILIIFFYEFSFKALNSVVEWIKK